MRCLLVGKAIIEDCNKIHFFSTTLLAINAHDDTNSMLKPLLGTLTIEDVIKAVHCQGSLKQWKH